MRVIFHRKWIPLRFRSLDESDGRARVSFCTPHFRHPAFTEFGGDFVMPESCADAPGVAQSAGPTKTITMSIEGSANPTVPAVPKLWSTVPDTTMLCSAGLGAAMLNSTHSDSCSLFTIESRLL